MADKILPFPEREIRKQIINKVKPTIPKSRGTHQKGHIFLNGKPVGKVKIPNNHSNIMKETKSKFIAQSLKLEPREFNDLIKCPLKGAEYFKILKKRI